MNESEPPAEAEADARELRERLDAVTKIGIALSAEHDLKALLRTILSESRKLTHADAGSLYLVEGEDHDKLRFVLAQNDSLDVPFVEMVLDISSKTVTGYVASTQKTLNLEDAYKIPADSEFSFSTKFDESVGYRCKSMLVVPMIDHRGRVAGCLQLINRKPNRDLRLENPKHAEEVVLPFREETVRLMESIASQSAVAIDKARLIDDLENTFEGLVYASVVAIESRDPTTSGHSERVAQLSVALAQAVSEVSVGKFKDVSFSGPQIRELRFAALLHDFGKVAVREQVLVKAKKLFPSNLEAVKLRFALAVREREVKVLRDVIARLGEADPGIDPAPFIEAAEETIRVEVGEIKLLLDRVLEANEPRILADGQEVRLQHISELSFTHLDGTIAPLLSEAEVGNLAIPRGSLNREERLEIESHVQHTYRFLTRIPWSEGLRDLPKIAGSHHEKLDGSGYPHGLTDAEIPAQSKIMSVADIFDALTAWDRPYKKAVPLEKALAILESEAERNHLEPQLVEIFRRRKIFEVIPKHV